MNGKKNNRHKTREAHTQERNKKILEQFIKLGEIKEHGVKKYTNDYIVRKLAKEYFLSHRTIEGIVFRTK